MRTLRLLFVILLGLVLICVALANRAPVTVSLMPQNVADFIGGRWSLSMPLFLLIFLTLVIGLVLGIVAEWMRESHYRNIVAQRRREVAARTRGGPVTVAATGVAVPQDDVLAILDASRPPPAGAATSGPLVPARIPATTPAAVAARP